MNQKQKIKNWVMKDGVVKRDNKVSVEHTFNLTYEKLLKELKNKMIQGHDDFHNFQCIYKDELEEFE